MDTTDNLYWLISDQLSSTTIITDESGTIISEMKYTAFNEIHDIQAADPWVVHILLSKTLFL